MGRVFRLVIWGAALLMGLGTFQALMVKAEEKQDMGGWEIDSPYNRHYNIHEMDEFKGKVIKIMELEPMEGMSPAVAMIIRDSDGEEVLVHVGPRWFVNPKTMGIRANDPVKIRGAWAEINDREIFMASKIKKRNTEIFYKIRLTKDGTPFWTMTPEQLAQETAKE